MGAPLVGGIRVAEQVNAVANFRATPALAYWPRGWALRGVEGQDVCGGGPSEPVMQPSRRDRRPRKKAEGPRVLGRRFRPVGDTHFHGRLYCRDYFYSRSYCECRFNMRNEWLLLALADGRPGLTLIASAPRRFESYLKSSCFLHLLSRVTLLTFYLGTKPIHWAALIPLPRLLTPRMP
jgi:hypothetical protein